MRITRCRQLLWETKLADDRLNALLRMPQEGVNAEGGSRLQENLMIIDEVGDDKKNPGCTMPQQDRPYHGGALGKAIVESEAHRGIRTNTSLRVLSERTVIRDVSKAGFQVIKIALEFGGS